jgi:hypothetical protein
LQKKIISKQGGEMPKSTLITILLLLVAYPFMYQSGNLNAEELTLTASQILEKVDDVINAPKDQDLRIKLILIDKKGKEKIREMSMLQKLLSKK